MRALCDSTSPRSAGFLCISSSRLSAIEITPLSTNRCDGRAGHPRLLRIPRSDQNAQRRQSQSLPPLGCSDEASASSVDLSSVADPQHEDNELPSPGAAENAEAASPRFRPLIDEQWQRVARILQPVDPGNRGRPSADARTIVNAIHYHAHYGIPWRELPPSFGSWQTAARRYRQLTTDDRWEQITRVLGEA